MRRYALLLTLSVIMLRSQAHGIQPAWGFSISHAEDITLKDVRLETVSPDERPPYYLSHTRRVTFRRVKPAFRQ